MTVRSEITPFCKGNGESQEEITPAVLNEPNAITLVRSRVGGSNIHVYLKCPLERRYGGDARERESRGAESV